MSSFSSHIMMNLRGDELHYHIQGVSSEENPSINIINLKNDIGLQKLKELGKRQFTSAVLTTYLAQKTLVPEGLFDSNKLENYLQYCYGDDFKRGATTNDFIRQIESHVVYTDHEDLAIITSVFPQLRVKHTISILLEAHLRSTIASQCIETTVYIEGDYMEIIVSDKHQLLFSNNFKVHSPEDYTYYVVYVLDVLGVSIKDHMVRLCGDTPNENRVLLKKYCPKADFHRFTHDKHLGKSLSNIKYAEESVLLNQYQCV